MGIIFVFDPLAVLLLIASQYTFEWAFAKRKDKEWSDYETVRGNAIARNEGPNDETPEPEDPPQEEDTTKEWQELYEDVDQETLDKEFEDEENQKKSLELQEESAPSVELEDRLTEEQLDALDEDPDWKLAKQTWKEEHPNDTIKNYKVMYLKGIISKLPWESYLPQPQDKPEYIQNAEQNEFSIWNRMNQTKDEDQGK